MAYTVKQVSEITGVTKRTLRFYDKIGLLRPAGMTEAGYRLYDDNNLELLQQIMFLRELDFSLKQIKDIVTSSQYDRKQALIRQGELLNRKAERLKALAELAIKTSRSIEGSVNTSMNKKEMFKEFDMSRITEHKNKYAGEVKQRWGNTDAYMESQAKTAAYTEEDWKRIHKFQLSNVEQMARLFKQGVAAESDEVQRLVKEFQQFITDNFYNCTKDILRGLGEMYVADERFKAYFDKYAEGLAVFVSKAIQHYCK
ncbi:MAG: MerR family transcriptional regulator [Clostridiaceae bacterium]|nr:MerR family transcriptional regulator [Clostridiaceae bacterium]